MSRQRKPGARMYPANPLITGAGTPGQHVTTYGGGQQPGAPYTGITQQQPPTAQPQFSTQQYNTQQYNVQQQIDAGQQQQGFSGYGKHPQSTQRKPDENSWSLTEMLRTGMEKIDMNTINKSFATIGTKLNDAYNYMLPQQQSGSLYNPQYNGQQFGAGQQQYGAGQYGQQPQQQYHGEGQYVQEQAQYGMEQQYVDGTQQQYTQQQYEAQQQYNAQQQQQYSEQYAQQYAQQQYAQQQQEQQHLQQQQQQQFGALTEQQIYNMQKHDYDRFSMYRGPEDPSPPPTAAVVKTETVQPAVQTTAIQDPSPAIWQPPSAGISAPTTHTIFTPSVQPVQQQQHFTSVAQQPFPATTQSFPSPVQPFPVLVQPFEPSTNVQQVAPEPVIPETVEQVTPVAVETVQPVAVQVQPTGFLNQQPAASVPSPAPFAHDKTVPSPHDFFSQPPAVNQPTPPTSSAKDFFNSPTPATSSTQDFFNQPTTSPQLPIQPTPTSEQQAVVTASPQSVSIPSTADFFSQPTKIPAKSIFPTVDPSATSGFAPPASSVFAPPTTSAFTAPKAPTTTADPAPIQPAAVPMPHDFFNQPLAEPVEDVTPAVDTDTNPPELSGIVGSPPTLPVETFGGVSIFNPAANSTEESTEESTETGWEKEFDDWNLDDEGEVVDKTDFEDIQL